MKNCPTQAVRPLVGLAAEKIIRDRHKSYFSREFTPPGQTRWRQDFAIKRPLARPPPARIMDSPDHGQPGSWTMRGTLPTARCRPAGI
ncbi:MAG: hypothetical protein ACQESR_06985 [Planctomycetota bacterium]